MPDPRTPEPRRKVPQRSAQKTLETYFAENSEVATSREERTQIFTRVLDEVMGLGPLEPLLKDPEVSEVMVNNKNTIFVEKKGSIICDFGPVYG